MIAKTWGWNCTCGGGLPIPVVPISSLEKANARIASLEAQLEKAETALNFYRNRSNHGSGFINEKPAGKIAFEYFAEKEKNGK